MDKADWINVLMLAYGFFWGVMVEKYFEKILIDWMGDITKKLQRFNDKKK